MPRWQNLILRRHASYLEGAEAPDRDFKDYRNHVLYVRDDCWGGAATAARKWYDIAVTSFRKRKWDYGVYATGVLSHYCTDPLMPLHTAQSEEANNIHKAVEWSVHRCYDELSELAERLGYPDLEVGDDEDWLEQVVLDGARLSNEQYQNLIEHYDFDRAIGDPCEGLNDTSRELLARLLGRAAVSVSRILERLVADADVFPQEFDIAPDGLLAVLQIPIHWFTRRMLNTQTRVQVEAMHDELCQTGRVVRTLPESQRRIRRLYEAEVPQQSEMVADHIAWPKPSIDPPQRRAA
jgi:hypothetical protein